MYRVKHEVKILICSSHRISLSSDGSEDTVFLDWPGHSQEGRDRDCDPLRKSEAGPLEIVLLRNKTSFSSFFLTNGFFIPLVSPIHTVAFSNTAMFSFILMF